ncbi:MAG TPA: phosphotransferase [Candidatus Limnocylindrales bacterium]|nr:phosphotransferase [Candidatus Limnocylindrales bacterium]
MIGLDGATVAEHLVLDWGIEGASLEPHDAGMNSRTWLVRRGSARWVAKAVPAGTRPLFESGLTVAAHVQGKGIPAGAPVATQSGALVVGMGGYALALLSFVAGSPLTGDTEQEQRTLGATLAGAHRALADLAIDEVERFHWLDPGAKHLDVGEWLRPVLVRVLAEWEAIPPASLTWGLLHSDPAPEAFLLDHVTGSCGLIDWDRALHGPLMYDVASAVMYVGGPTRAGALLEAYLQHGPLGQAEIEHSLAPMLRVRWAVQADYFARRIATHDMTGLADPAENEEGLLDARRALVG